MELPMFSLWVTRDIAVFEGKLTNGPITINHKGDGWDPSFGKEQHWLVGHKLDESSGHGGLTLPAEVKIISRKEELYHWRGEAAEAQLILKCCISGFSLGFNVCRCPTLSSVSSLCVCTCLWRKPVLKVMKVKLSPIHDNVLKKSVEIKCTSVKWTFKDTTDQTTPSWACQRQGFTWVRNSECMDWLH